MSISDIHTKALAEFPPVLQDLVKAEVVAGNSIVEIGSGFPAPPVGACLKLAGRVTTRPRGSDRQIDFYERNNSDYSGEFTDAKRFFFVLEPPLPPEPMPDMDAIRAELEARQCAADAELRQATERFAASKPLQLSRHASSLVDQFCESMNMNYERWHDGVGYDLELLKSATTQEREQIERMLASGAVDDWRDVEALAALDSPRARAALRRAFKSAGDAMRIALISHAPALFGKSQRTKAVVSALENTETYGGLTQTLLVVQDFHPPRVVQALLDGVRLRDGATAGQFAAMLLYLHGKASAPYDMEQRPFFLKFQGGDREMLFRELCERIGVSPTRRQSH